MQSQLFVAELNVKRVVLQVEQLVLPAPVQVRQVGSHATQLVPLRYWPAGQTQTEPDIEKGRVQVRQTVVEVQELHPTISEEHAWQVELAEMKSAVDWHTQTEPLSCQRRVVSQAVQSVPLVQAVQPKIVLLQLAQTLPVWYW